VTRYAPATSEVIVVDDASRSHTVTTVASGFPGVRVVRLDRQSGFCVAANAGIAAATGAIVQLLNDDTEVTAGWAEPAIAAFEDPTVAAVAPLVLCHPGRANYGSFCFRVDSAGDCYYIGGVAAKRGYRQPLSGSHLHSRSIFGASAAGAFFRREAIVKVGAFPESFGAYFEDVDLAFRLHWAGYRVVFEPASRLLHHVSASYGRPRRRLLEQQSTNEERVFWRNLPGRALAGALPRHLAVLAGKAQRRWQEGTLLPFVFGRIRLLGEISEIVSHRRQLCRNSPTPIISDWKLASRYGELTC
jgi:GT2 family glycosyltransferase